MRTFVIVYRTGGTDNFKWHRSDTCGTREIAQVLFLGITAMGFPSYIVDAVLSLSIGLPETYEYTS